MSEIEIIGQEDVTAEEMDLSTQEGREAFLDSQFVAAGDYLVLCNSCGFVQKKSDPSPCPNGQHGQAGWSYAGPIPDAEPEKGIIVESPERPPIADDEPDADGDLADQIEEAIKEVCQAQQDLDQAERDEELAASAKKAATLKADSTRDWLSDASRRLRKLRAGRFPDGDKYPMFDKGPKDELNGLFSKPEAVQPLPPDSYGEFCRREQVATKFGQLGLKAGTLKALNDAGLVTVRDFVIKSDALVEANASMTTVKGITEKRFDEITDALVALTSGWLERWAEMHPETNNETD